MIRISVLFAGRRHGQDSKPSVPHGLILAIVAQLLLFVTVTHGQSIPASPQRQNLGSLNVVGEGYVNDSRAPSELTVFAGDTLRTGATGTAVVTTADRLSFQISPLSQVLFAGDSRYFVELKQGTIAMKSSGGAGLASVRAGNFVVVQTNRDEQTSATIESIADGSFFITCTAGNVGVLPLTQASGLFLQAGQSARISPNGELSALNSPPTANPRAAGSSHRLWIYLGLAGAGAAAGTAAALANGGSHSPVSPSSP